MQDRQWCFFVSYRKTLSSCVDLNSSTGWPVTKRESKFKSVLIFSKYIDFSYHNTFVDAVNIGEVRQSRKS